MNHSISSAAAAAKTITKANAAEEQLAFGPGDPPGSPLKIMVITSNLSLPRIRLSSDWNPRLLLESQAETLYDPRAGCESGDLR
jgi:hypothetical protein